jgi:hypothetical protein
MFWSFSLCLTKANQTGSNYLTDIGTFAMASAVLEFLLSRFGPMFLPNRNTVA